MFSLLLPFAIFVFVFNLPSLKAGLKQIDNRACQRICTEIIVFFKKKVLTIEKGRHDSLQQIQLLPK